MTQHPLLANSLWAIAGSFTSKGLNFAAIAWIAKILGAEVFGEYNVIQTTVGLFGTFSGLGMGMAATKLIAEYRDKDPNKVGKIISTLYILSFAISLLIALIFFCTSEIVATHFLNNNKLTLLLQITAIMVVFDAINGVQNGVLTGFEAFKEITFIGFIIGIITTPLLVLGAVYYGLIGLTFMLLLSRFLNMIINKWYLNKKFKLNHIKVNTAISKDVLKNIFDIGVPTFLSSLATSPISWISTSLMVNQPMGYNALGTYNTATQLRTLVLLLPDSAGKVTMPSLANSFGNQDLKKFKKTVFITFVWNLVLSVLPALFLFFLGGFFQQFFGNKFNLSTDLIFVVLATAVMVALTNAVGYIFICSNLIWYDFILRIFWGLALLIFIYFYGRYHGAVGYATSIMNASIVHGLAQGIILLWKFKINREK